MDAEDEARLSAVLAEAKEEVARDSPEWAGVETAIKKHAELVKGK